MPLCKRSLFFALCSVILASCVTSTPPPLKETVIVRETAIVKEIVVVTQEPPPTYTPYPTYTLVPTSTSTPTPTTTPTSTPTPTPTPEPQVVVEGDSVNLRAGPGTAYDVVGSVAKGDRFALLARTTDGEWWQVQYKGREAWVFASLVQANCEPEAVSVAAVIPPTPTPRATATFTPTPKPPFQIFDETGIEPWNAMAFHTRLEQVHAAIFRFKEGFFGGHCLTYSWFRESLVTAAAFTDVPPDWEALYVEYRTAIDESVTAAKPIHDVCVAGGGSITMELAREIYAVIDKWEIRFLGMIAETSQKLGIE